jgi:putative ABC transport system ATP-binding protein
VTLAAAWASAAGTGPPPAVRLEGVKKSYPTSAGEVLAVDGIDLEVAAGTSLAIVGPSGGGKSTLLGLMGGLEPPSAGKVMILGQDIGARNAEARAAFRREHLGFLFQAYDLLPFLTAAENVALQVGISGRGIDDIGAMLERLGIGDEADKLPDQLSGGQRQRVGIARCLAHGPDLVLADEPTGELDSVSSDTVMSLMLGMVRELGATLVVVTHDTSVAARLDRVVTLRDGRVV